jgi:DNA-binding NtrC family response regulator
VFGLLLRSALGLCSGSRPPKRELILSDVNMPEVDGIDLALQARKLCPQTRILLMSGDPTSETIRQRQQCEGCMFEIMAKPFGARQLLDRIKGIVH